MRPDGGNFADGPIEFLNGPDVRLPLLAGYTFVEGEFIIDFGQNCFGGLVEFRGWELLQFGQNFSFHSNNKLNV